MIGVTTVIRCELEISIFFALHSALQGLVVIQVTVVIARHKLAMISVMAVMASAATLFLYRMHHGWDVMVVTIMIIWRHLVLCCINPLRVGIILLWRISY